MDFDLALQALGRVLRGIEEQETRALVRALAAAPAIHLAGKGRSGLALRAFATRLAELGRPAQIVGEPGAGACRAGDLVLLCSGSGRSESLLVVADRAIRLGARVAVLTAAPVSPLARLATLRVLLSPVLPPPPPPSGTDPSAGAPDEAGLLAAMRTLFDQAAWLYLDLLVPMLREATGQGAAEAETRRPNLE